MKLTRFENRWAQATLASMFPGSREEGFAGIQGMDVRGFLTGVMRTLPFKAALGLRVAVWMVALAPLVVLRRAVTIAGLGEADRERVVATLSASGSYSVRSLTMILKTFGALLYAGDDRIRARLRPIAARAPIPLRLKRTPARVA